MKALAPLVLLASFMTLLHQPTPAAGGSFGSPLPLPLGDWVVRTPVVLVDVTITLRGDLIVARGGSLDLRGVTLRLDGEADGQRKILVRAGGALFARPSPLTLRRTRIETGDRGGRFAFEAARGARLQLVGTTIRGAGWDEEHPGLVIAASPGEEPTLADCEIRESFVGLTIREGAHEVLLASFHGNERGAVAVEGGAAAVRWVEVFGQPVGIDVGPGGMLSLESSFLGQNGVALRSRGGHVDLAHNLFLGNGTHLLLDGEGTAAMSDNLFAAAGEVGVVAAGGASVRLRFNDLVANRFGVRNAAPGLTPEIDARGNWWGAADGPSGDLHPGSGDPVSEGVRVRPWCESGCRRAPQD